MRRVLFVLLIGSTVQSGPPDTEVFLVPFSVSGAKVVVGTPLNISNNPGYDNQPCFTPDGGSVLFTSVRGGRKPDPANSAASGSDIYRYDVASRQVIQVTDTPESEYSPTVTPDGRHISVIRVEADGTQRLWRFTMDDKNPELVLRDVKPVGYHAWANASTLALFVLGQPATLQVASVDTGQAVVAAKGIGRSIQRIPGAGISYVSRETTAEGKPPLLTVRELDASTRESRRLVEVPQGAADADTAWTPDGMLLVPVQGKLFGWRRGDRAFTEVADLESLGLRSVTRLSLSPTGDHIAIVAQPRN